MAFSYGYSRCPTCDTRAVQCPFPDHPRVFEPAALRGPASKAGEWAAREAHVRAHIELLEKQIEPPQFYRVVRYDNEQGDSIRAFLCTRKGHDAPGVVFCMRDTWVAREDALALAKWLIDIYAEPEP